MSDVFNKLFETGIISEEVKDQIAGAWDQKVKEHRDSCLLYTSPSPRDATLSRMPSSA